MVVGEQWISCEIIIIKFCKLLQSEITVLNEDEGQWNVLIPI